MAHTQHKALILFTSELSHSDFLQTQKWFIRYFPSYKKTQTKHGVYNKLINGDLVFIKFSGIVAAFKMSLHGV